MKIHSHSKVTLGGDMVFINIRKKSKELLYYEALKARSHLSQNELYQYEVVVKGYEGECLYDDLLDESGHNNLLVLRDIYLKVGQSVTQFDSILISDYELKINEIKNFSGDYKYVNDQLFKGNQTISDDPLHQLGRATGKIKRLVQPDKNRLLVEGKLIYVNDEFYLTSDNDMIWKNIVARGNLKRYFRQVNSVSSSGDRAEKILEILQKHEVDNPYFNLKADFNRVKTGIYCGRCGSFHLQKDRFHFSCLNCGSKESNETHVLRAICDYQHLFYDDLMTRTKLYEFVDGKVSGKTIWRVLSKFCRIVKNGPSTYYKLKYHDFNEAMADNDISSKRYKDKLNLNN